jgi:hypothetical protein
MRHTQIPLENVIDYAQAGHGGLLGEIIAFVRTYVVMTPAQLVAVALWIVHTHAVMAAEQTPYMLVTSPEKQCGKSRLLEVLRLLVAREWYVIGPSEAVIYRTIHANVRTLLLDEVDTIFNPRTAKDHDGLRALINAGNRRGVTVPRCLGSSHDTVEFRVYSAKALAGIGTLPDTITDRSLPIRLKRRARSEQVARFRRRTAEPAGAELHSRVAAWAKAHAKALERARPAAPDELSDRMQDACEPLLAIADIMRGPWPRLSRAALVELCTNERHDDEKSMRLRLLADIRDIFLENGRRDITTDALIERLIRIPESQWGRYYGRTLEPRDLAALLKPFGVRSGNVSRRDKDGRRKVPKGYKRAPLQDAWERYAP